MFTINSLDDVRGNNVAIYSIKTLLERKSFPKFSIMSGVMGVGKTSVAKVVADMLDKTGFPVKVYNFGLNVDMQKLQEEVFSLTPMQPKAVIFEELHGIPKAEQNALLQMFDSQPQNVYIIATTTEVGKLIRPLRSRARIWEFRLLSTKQLEQLLNDYLDSQGVKLPQESKTSLLRSCKGIPRDLLSNADFAISGSFNANQLDDLLGNVSDNAVYTVFCSLKSNTVDFVANLEDLLEGTADHKLAALNDFWLRYLMERSGSVRTSLGKGMSANLDAIFSNDDVLKISKMLLRCSDNTLILELISMNMQLTNTAQSAAVGYQRTKAQQAERELQYETQRNNVVPTADARLTRDTIKDFKL